MQYTQRYTVLIDHVTAQTHADYIITFPFESFPFLFIHEKGRVLKKEKGEKKEHEDREK